MERDFSLLHNFQTYSEPHPASYPTGTGEVFPRVYSGRSVKLTTLLHLEPRSIMMELYLHSPMRLHGELLD
jgi:hypothetical protein